MTVPPKLVDRLAEAFRSGPLTAAVLHKGEIAFMGSVKECMMFKLSNPNIPRFKLVYLKKVFEADKAEV